MLTVMKGLPLAYNKDMQEDKECTFDSVDTLKECINIFTGMISTITINKEDMKMAAINSFINATDAAEYLVKKGMPFRDAHFVIGNLVAKCIEEDKFLTDLKLEDFKEESEMFDEDIFECLDAIKGMEKKKMTGSPNREIVSEYIENNIKLFEE